MRYVSVIISFAFVLLLVLFASSNKEETRLELFPLPQEITAPLYLLTFIMMFIGFLIGGVVIWNAARGTRRAARQATKRAAAMENDLAAMRARAELAEDRLTQLAAGKPDAALEDYPLETGSY